MVRKTRGAMTGGSHALRAFGAFVAALLLVALSMPGARSAVADDGDSTGNAALAATTGSLGAQDDAIAPGVYTVPVALMKADDHNTPSGAAAAFANEARLSVGSGGVATLTVDVQPVVFGTITGYASQYQVYQGDSTSSDTQPATVLEYGAASSGEQLADAQGNAVPSRISFVIPDLTWDGVYLSMFVDVMNSSPNAWLDIDYDNRTYEGEPITYQGTAHVDQFGGYDINVKVLVQGGIIQGLNIEGANFAGQYAEFNESNKLAKAIEGMKDKWNDMWIGHGHSNAEALYKAGGDELDAVSGATYSSNKIRDAVMNALGISWSDETINVPTEALEPKRPRRSSSKPRRSRRQPRPSLPSSSSPTAR